MTSNDPASGQGSAAPAGPAATPPAAPLWSTLLIAAGAVVIAGTYLWILATQPATLGADLGHTTLAVMAGYLTGALLIAAGALPRIPATVLALLPVMIALNVVIGQIVGTLTPIPLYLDSLGTVLIGVLAGPAAGALTGVLTNLIWGVTINPSLIPFSAGAAFIGAAAGWAARTGAFRRLWTAILAGGVAGIPAGLLGAPVAAYVFGGGLGVGTGGVVAAFQAAGASMLAATTLQAIPSDIIDKAIVFAVAFLAFRAVPQRLRSRFAFTAHSLPPTVPGRPAGASTRSEEELL